MLASAASTAAAAATVASLLIACISLYLTCRQLGRRVQVCTNQASTELAFALDGCARLI